MPDLDDLNSRIVACRLCPRLVEWRETVAAEKRSSYSTEEYWGKPVPIFGDPNADRMVLGLAPAAHGANRTGQMFTGDRSGEWLYRALHKAGVANHPRTESRFDGMQLSGVLIAATAHCAPPANKPLPGEVANCSRYLLELLAGREWRSMLCLGSIAWNHAHRLLNTKASKFGHLATSQIGATKLVASYHPSQQNTFTGKLTEQMLDDAVAEWLR